MSNLKRKAEVTEGGEEGTLPITKVKKISARCYDIQWNLILINTKDHGQRGFLVKADSDVWTVIKDHVDAYHRFLNLDLSIRAHTVMDEKLAPLLNHQDVRSLICKDDYFPSDFKIKECTFIPYCSSNPFEFLPIPEHYSRWDLNLSEDQDDFLKVDKN